jgi:hypothetical protein
VKTITPIGILLLGLVAACGVTNSKKFNPHDLDGLYKLTYEMHDPTQSFYTNYMFVDYPDMQICAVNGQGAPPIYNDWERGRKSCSYKRKLLQN